MGVVVTYHPDTTIRERIDTYIGSLSELVVIDNTPGGSGVLRELLAGAGPVFTVVYNGRNRGIATALNQGARLARDKGYRWILTMDQDSAFTDHRFFDESPAYMTKTTAIIAPANSAANRQPDPLRTPVTEPPIVMTSGSLLNLRVWEETGGFDEKLFIDEVDHDYCLRARLRRCRIVQLNTATLRHSLGQHRHIGTGRFRRCIHFHSPERTYYIFRNNFYLFQRYSKPFAALMRKRKLILLRDLLIILLFAPGKRSHLRHIARGIRDFRRNRYGPIVPQPFTATRP